MAEEFLGYPLEEWYPQEPQLGPPLPKWLKIFWPWYKPAPPIVYTCPYCGATFSTNADMQAHIQAVHPEQPPVYTCPYCGATFTSQTELDAHIQAVHPPPTVYTCPYCGATFDTDADLQAHIQAEHPSPPVYICTYCGAEFNTSEELDQHIATAHPPPVYTCTYCGETFNSQAELNTHITMQHFEEAGMAYLDLKGDLASKLMSPAYLAYGGGMDWSNFFLYEKPGQARYAAADIIMNIAGIHPPFIPNIDSLKWSFYDEYGIAFDDYMKALSPYLPSVDWKITYLPGKGYGDWGSWESTMQPYFYL